VTGAEGAKYDSQGQARAKRARRPWSNITKYAWGLKGRNNDRRITPFSGLMVYFDFVTRGDALRACPWLLYFAPSALCNLTICSAAVWP